LAILLPTPLSFDASARSDRTTRALNLPTLTDAATTGPLDSPAPAAAPPRAGGNMSATAALAATPRRILTETSLPGGVFSQTSLSIASRLRPSAAPARAIVTASKLNSPR